MDKWIVTYEKYTKAVEVVNAAIQQYVAYSLPCTSEEKMTEEKYKNHNYVVLRVDNTMEGFSIDVTKSEYNEDNQMIVLKGEDEINLLYAAHDFRNKYIPHARTCYGAKIIDYFHKVFNEPIKEYHYATKPRIKERGLWTWGYCIYDYKRYIDNMVKLKMNTIIIWNDFIPVNHREVIDYAHENGVKVIFGYQWGWGANRDEIIDLLKNREGLQEQIVTEYKKTYMDLNIDGIYFQTYTEMQEEEVDGITIADAAVDLVNNTAKEILELTPDLKLQFGLHATSVKNKLDVIAKVDKRVSIVWEDCGAFPYEYLPQNTDDFDKTIEFTDKIRELRDAEFGVVLKGFTYLDWFRFEHQTDEFILGKNNAEFIKQRADNMHEVWKHIQAYWIKNANLVQETMRHFNDKTMVTALLEDGCFEDRIPYPAAIFAELMWDCERNLNEIMCDAALREDVTFAN